MQTHVQQVGGACFAWMPDCSRRKQPWMTLPAYTLGRYLVLVPKRSGKHSRACSQGEWEAFTCLFPAPCCAPTAPDPAEQELTSLPEQCHYASSGEPATAAACAKRPDEACESNSTFPLKILFCLPTFSGYLLPMTKISIVQNSVLKSK